MADTLYNLLGVAKNATERELKKARNKKLLTKHPDKNSDPEAAKETDKIIAAYNLLMDSTKRANYDREIDENGQFIRPTSKQKSRYQTQPSPASAPKAAPKATDYSSYTKSHLAITSKPDTPKAKQQEPETISTNQATRSSPMYTYPPEPDRTLDAGDLEYFDPYRNIYLNTDDQPVSVRIQENTGIDINNSPYAGRLDSSLK